MRYKNIEVIKAFLNKEFSRKSYTGNLYSTKDGKLINYKTIIALWKPVYLIHLNDGRLSMLSTKDDILYLNTQKYSVTTSTIQNTIKREVYYHPKIDLYCLISEKEIIMLANSELYATLERQTLYASL